MWRRTQLNFIYSRGYPPPDRWSHAESLAQSKIYILADDDCLPPPDLDCAYVESIFDRLPDFGLLAIGNPNRDYGMYTDQDVVEAWACGGIRFIRKGIVTEFPDNFTGDDGMFDGYLKKAGYRSGYLRKWPLMHMGDGYSVWKQLQESK